MEATKSDQMKQFQAHVANLTKHRVRVLIISASNIHVPTGIQVKCESSIDEEQLKQVKEARNALFAVKPPPPFDMSKLQRLQAIQASKQNQLLKVIL